MPKRKSVWSSWVYTEPAGPHPDRIDLTSLYDVDHGGAPRHGTGVQWVREVLASHSLPGADKILLLAQPRVLGHVFNPISFWLCHDAQGALRVVIAEVSNTFGDRHSYLCHRADLGQITREDTLTATKIFTSRRFSRWRAVINSGLISGRIKSASG